MFWIVRFIFWGSDLFWKIYFKRNNNEDGNDDEKLWVLFYISNVIGNILVKDRKVGVLILIIWKFVTWKKE